MKLRIEKILTRIFIRVIRLFVSFVVKNPWFENYVET